MLFLWLYITKLTKFCTQLIFFWYSHFAMEVLPFFDKGVLLLAFAKSQTLRQITRFHQWNFSLKSFHLLPSVEASKSHLIPHCFLSIKTNIQHQPHSMIQSGQTPMGLSNITLGQSIPFMQHQRIQVWSLRLKCYSCFANNI